MFFFKKSNCLKEGEPGSKSGSEEEEDEKVADDVEDEISKNLNKAMKMEYEFFKKQMKSWQKDPLTLSHILNILDGLLECHGRILVRIGPNFSPACLPSADYYYQPS